MIHFPTSLGVSERATKLMSAAVHASKARSAEQVNKQAARANGQASGPVTYVLILRLFWTIVHLITNSLSTPKLGETCGVVRPEDDHEGKKMCYTKQSQAWPMECRIEAEAESLPDDYQSPAQPLEAGAITGN